MLNRSVHPVRYVTFSAMFAALIAVATAYLPHLHIPFAGGHTCVHLGDSVIYLCASLLPTGYACIAAAIGGCLADMLCGSTFWAPFSFVIKALVALCFTAKSDKILAKRNFCAMAGACLITVLGYYAAEGILFGNFITPVHSIPANVIQSVAGGILYVVIGLILDKTHLKKQIHL